MEQARSLPKTTTIRQRWPSRLSDAIMYSQNGRQGSEEDEEAKDKSSEECNYWDRQQEGTEERELERSDMSHDKGSAEELEHRID